MAVLPKQNPRQWGIQTLMPYRSNAAEAYSEPDSGGEESPVHLDLLPPAGLTQPLWRSLASGLRYTFAPEKLPPLQLTSRPVNVGLLLADRLSLPWFRTVFTNVGDVISPETLPPLELESQPVDVGELLTDQLGHYWWSSLLRNLADRVAPERMASLELTAKPITDVIPEAWLLLPLWSEVISTPKVFYPDRPAAPGTPLPPLPRPAIVNNPPLAEARPDPMTNLVRDIRRSRIRQRIWITLAAAQVAYLLLVTFWPGFF